MEFGLLQTLTFASSERNFDFGAALAHAINDWQRDTWLANDPRLKGAIVITQENPAAAIEEIKERSRDRRFVQIDFAPRSLQPAGARCYWPIYEAAVEHDLVVGMHVQGRNGYPQTGGGFPSFYFENYHSNVQSVQGAVSSLAFQGVFERFPTLKFVLIECGIGWIPETRRGIWRGCLRRGCRARPTRYSFRDAPTNHSFIPADAGMKVAFI